MGNIIGRKQEIRELNDLYNSDKAQLLAVYGRRRVGKTFLVDEALKGRITFRHAGLSPNNEDSGKKKHSKNYSPKIPAIVRNVSLFDGFRTQWF